MKFSFKQRLKQRLNFMITLILILSLSLSFAESDVKLPSLNGGYEQLDLMIKNIKEQYYKDIPDDKLREAMYKGIFQALDQHSVYFTPAEYKAFNEGFQGSFVGVGVSIAVKDGYIEVVAPIKNTPAERAGIKSGDIIVSVDGVDIKGWPTDKVSQKIRGEAGTMVSLTVQRSGEAKPLIFKLIRAVINIDSAEYEVVDDVDVLRITSWDENTYNQLREILKENTFNRGLIVDLRNNPGGLLSQVVNITDLFLKRGERIVTIDYAHEEDVVYEAKYGGVTTPLVVLIDKGSASASEIFAAAIQDNKRGTVVGQTSYGKGTVQGILQLPDEGAMKLTIASYKTPANKDINGKGVVPDVSVKNLSEVDTIVSKFYDLQGLTTLKKGAKTMEVIGAQQRLRYLGFNLPVDGTFGDALEKALLTFQKQKQIKVTGTIDLETRVQLNLAATNQGKSKLVDLQMKEAKAQLKKLMGGM